MSSSASGSDPVTPEEKAQAFERLRVESKNRAFRERAKTWAIGALVAVIAAGGFFVVKDVEHIKGNSDANRDDSRHSLVIVESVVCGQTPRPTGCPANFPSQPQTAQTAQVQQFAAALAQQLIAQMKTVYPPPALPH